MQSILFLRDVDDGEVTRLINIDLIVTAAPHQDNPKHTRLLSAGADITLHMPFPRFLEQVEHLIKENYRVSHEASVSWYKKRMDDTANMVLAMVEEFKK
jgi:hypothetical protein